MRFVELKVRPTDRREVTKKIALRRFFYTFFPDTILKNVSHKIFTSSHSDRCSR